MSVKEDLQKPDVGDIVELFQLDATSLGAPNIFFFTKEVNPDGTFIVYGGETYTFIDIEADGFLVSSDGAQPKPILRLAVIDPIIRAAVRIYNDLLGARLTRIRTFRKHLDNGEEPDGGAQFGGNLFILDHKQIENNTYIEWLMATPLDHRELKLPKRLVNKRHCDHRYREWDAGSQTFTPKTCPYVGGLFFNTSGASISNPAEDMCGKRLSDCKLRFGDNGILPIHIFPGVGDPF